MPREVVFEDAIRTIERDIDSAFLATLNLGGIWKSMLRNYALDKFEELLTGHGTINDSSSASLMTYSNTIINACNVLLRHIEMVGSDAKTDLPRDLDARMKRAIAAAGLYSTVVVA